MDNKVSYKVKAEVIKGMASVFKGNDTVTVKATPIGWSIASVSADHVCMTTFVAPRMLFDTYTEGPEFTMAVKDIKLMVKLKGDMLNIALDDGVVRMSTDTGAKVKVPLYDSNDPVREPDLRCDTSFTLSCEAITDYIKAAGLLDPAYMKFSTDMGSGKVEVSSSGDVEDRDMAMTFDTSVDGGYDACSMYGFGYVVPFTEAVGKGPLYIQLGTDYPMKITADRGWRASILIAPRIERE